MTVSLGIEKPYRSELGSENTNRLRRGHSLLADRQLQPASEGVVILNLPERRVEAFTGQQLFVRAFLRDPSSFENDDLVRRANSGHRAGSSSQIPRHEREARREPER